MKEVFNDYFRATKSNESPLKVDFRILGLHKKELFDSKGDLITIQYYENYNQETDTFTDLAVEERRVYSRDAGTGLLYLRTTDIDWYDTNGSIGATKTQVNKYYSAKKGFQANKRARQNLLDNASMYLYQQLVINNAGDTIAAETEVEDFDIYTTVQQAQYIKSTTQPLIDAITNAADVNHVDYRAYMTEAIKTVLISILNVAYA